MAWLGAGELVARLTRIATTIVLAWLLTPVDLGVAALALTAFEIVRSFAAGGIGQAVVRATTAELEATLLTARRAALIVCVALAVVQVVAGALAAYWTGRPSDRHGGHRIIRNRISPAISWRSIRGLSLPA